MPTNEEKRTAAKMIREAGDLFPSAWQRMRDILGMPKDFTLPQVRDGLADLIEPEPGRTCRFDLVENGPVYAVWKCSACGFEAAENKTDAGTNVFDPNYCEDCGAKVVE